jgi:hypothetical protein
MAIRYDKGDTLVMSPAALKAIEAGGAIKLWESKGRRRWEVSFFPL